MIVLLALVIVNLIGLKLTMENIDLVFGSPRLAADSSLGTRSLASDFDKSPRTVRIARSWVSDTSG